MSPISHSLLTLALLTTAGAQEPVTVTITTPPGQMKYDRPVITAAPGTKLRILFENKDEMPHNLVFCTPSEGVNDKGLPVAQSAWTMGAVGMEKGWIPENPRIWAHSGLVDAHKSEELRITVPDAPGVYPYVCTFPGHAMAMNGELRVVTEGPKLEDLKFKLYLGDWDKLPDFDSLKPHREGAVPDNLIDMHLEGMTEHFGLRFNASLTAPEDGQYLFFMASDDGSRLLIDGKKVMEMDGIHASGAPRSRRLKLNKGRHDVQIDYFEGAGQEELFFAWGGRSFSPTQLSRWAPDGWNGSAGSEPKQDQNTGIPLAPENGEAVMYRNFIEGVSPRGIAVGYPNGVNLCFDADQVDLALLWRGAFIDAKRHWTDRGGGNQPPLGFDTVKVSQGGPSLAVLAGPDAHWPARVARSAGVHFRGYRLDAHRFPTFRYDLDGGVSVEESYAPGGDYKTGDEHIVRTMVITGAPVAGLHARLASGNLKGDASDRWSVNGEYSVTVEGGTPMQSGSDLVVPVNLAGQPVTLRATYRWAQ